MDGQVIHILNTNEVEGLADPSLQQYECSLYTEKDERDVIQKKTFTKWVNKHLIKSWRFAKVYVCLHACCTLEDKKCSCQKVLKGVVDLFEDLRDGHNLLSLLEVLSGEILSREKGRMRVHMLQNVKIALNFLKNQRIKLVNIRPEDIVDGNPKLTLGLVWTIILHYQISDIIQHDDNELPKEVLLKWAQLTTDGYPNVNVRDFTNSWKDGLAFLAILHRNRPDFLNFRERINRPARENLEIAFNFFEKNFNVCKLLDPEDVDTFKPDEKSLITYISSVYELFKEPPAYHPFRDVNQNKKLNEYNEQAVNLIKWISLMTNKLKDLSWRGQSNIDLEMLDKDLQTFHDKELPNKLQEKLRLMELNKNLTKLNLNEEISEDLNQYAIENLWSSMIDSFHARQEAIQKELDHDKKIKELAEIIVDESTRCHLNLESIKNLMTKEADQLGHINLVDTLKNCNKIQDELNTEEDRLNKMFSILEILKKDQYEHYHKLKEKLTDLVHLQQSLVNLLQELKLQAKHEAQRVEHEKIKHMEAVQKQKKPLTEEELIASNPLFSHVAECTIWLQDQLDYLNKEQLKFTNESSHLKIQLEKFTGEHKQLQDYYQNVENAQSAKEEIAKEELSIYNHLLNRLTKSYDNVFELLEERILNLKQLIPFIEEAEKELAWLNEHEEKEINRDWSSLKNLNIIDLEKYHRDLIELMDEREANFTNVLDKGEQLINEDLKIHPANKLIKNTILKMQDQWSWLLQLSNCLETQIKHVIINKQFSDDLIKFNKIFDSIEEKLNEIDCVDNGRFPIEDGEKLLQEIYDLKESINQQAQSIKDIALKCKKVVPLKQRRTPLSRSVKVYAACMIKQTDCTIEQGEQCTLLDNSTRSKWTVRTNSNKELKAPSCCFVIAPPDKEALDSTDDLKAICEKLSSIWAIKQYKLRKSMIYSTLNIIKNWDFETYSNTDPKQRNVILNALESDINNLVEDEKINFSNEQLKDGKMNEIYKDFKPDSRNLIEELAELKKRFNDYDMQIKAQQEEKTQQNENLNKYLELCDSVMADLTEKKNILVQRAHDSIPQEQDIFEQLVIDHKVFQTEFEQLKERIEEANILLNKIDKKPFELQSKHNSITMLSSHTEDLVDLYVKRLQELGNIFYNYEACLDTLGTLEIAFAMLDDVPGDELSLRRIEEQVKEIEQKIKVNQFQLDDLVSNLNCLKQTIEKTRPKQATHVDVFRLEEDIKSLLRRWDTLSDNVISCKRAIEQYSSLIINFRSKMDVERAWLSQMASQITSATVTSDVELANTIYENLAEHEPIIEEMKVVSSQLIHEAQSYDKKLKEYRDVLEEVHPSLDANFSGKSHQTITGSEQIANEIESLQIEYNNLCETVINHLNELEEENRKINEQAEELEELQLEIAVQEAINFHDNIEKFTIWLTNVEDFYTNASVPSRVMETLNNQLTEQEQINNELKEQRLNLEELQQKANELKYFNQSHEDVQLIKNLLTNVDERWLALADKAEERVNFLNQAMKECKEFHDSLNELCNWLQQTDEQLNGSFNAGNDSSKIKQMLLKHKEFQRKLNAKQAIYDAIMKVGRTLKDKAPKDEIDVLQEMLNKLKNEWSAVCIKSIERQRKLEEALLVSGQLKDAIQALFDWLEKAKVSLSDDRLFGDLETVNNIIESHKNFQEDLKNRSRTLNQVQKFCTEVCENAEENQNQIGDIPDKLSELEVKWEEVNKLSDAKELQLIEAHNQAEKLHRTMHDLFGWLSEAEIKLRFADNLPDDEETTKNQILEHKRFVKKMEEQEIAKYKTITLAKQTQEKCHPDASSVLQHWITTIHTIWSDVANYAKHRETKLNEHLEKLRQIMTLIDDLYAWLTDSENTLKVADAEFMPDEIDILESLIEQHQEFIDAMSSKQPDIEMIAKTFSIKKMPAVASRMTNIKRKAGGTSFSANFSTPTLKQEDVRNPKAKLLIEKWRSVWLLAMEHMRRLKDQLNHCKEMEKMKTFEFDEWRSRFLRWLKTRKARILDFFKQMDTNNDGKLTRDQFIEGFLKSKFITSRMELEYVAPIFDRNNDGLIDQKEYLDTLRSDRDIPKTDNEIIQNEVHAQVAKCTCPHKYKVFQVEEGKYSFGESQKLCLVRILRSTVMVRVGGGWASLDEFLVKHDPCRARGRTNVELREQFILANGVSQSMTPFITKIQSTANSHCGSTKGSLQDLLPQFPATGPITKIREKTERSVPMSTNRAYCRSSHESYLNGNSQTLNNHSNNSNSANCQNNGFTKNNGHMITCAEHPNNKNSTIQDNYSEESFTTETDSGTKSRSRSRLTLHSNGSRTPVNSRPTSRPPSRVGSDLSTESLENYKKFGKTNKLAHSTNSNGKQRYLVSPSKMQRTLSFGDNNLPTNKERWK